VHPHFFIANQKMKKLIGKVPPEAVKFIEIPRLSPSIIERFKHLEDLTGDLSDAMDLIGIEGAVPASVLKPNLIATKMVGQAVTVRNVERVGTPHLNALTGKGTMGEHEAYNLSEPGDVIVIEGLVGVSNMGGQSATLAHRSGCAGAIIDGSYRDPDVSRTHGFPIWAKGATPITGKWRLQTTEINGTVRIGGVAVRAGDLVAADEAGVVFIPFERVQEVLEAAEKIHQGDLRQKKDIDSGVDLAVLAQTKYK
jgi:4-hydroxy-4-methyl-2-oxoglutarate aldolase